MSSDNAPARGAAQQQPLQIVARSGSALRDYVPALAALRIEVFREWPYLYEGDMDYERNYLQTYVDSPRAVVVLALAGDQVVGAATGLPLADETPEFQQPFIDHGYAPAEVFYCAESVLRAPWRGRGVGHEFFALREQHARGLGGFRYSAFCRVERPDDHPLRPANYAPLDAFWQRRGYREQRKLRTFYSWKDVGADRETEKPMIFWLKHLESTP
ncbi:MAG: GNAT family acetyltransferase [Spongiibacteraceae bacterium]|nr:GNAT family acetyltransferase [Spongiibacteraceae bacterium]